LKVVLSGDTEETEIPLVGFHAPYGEDNPEGFKMRVYSLIQVLDADVGDGLAFQAHDSAILIGDLNLDLNDAHTRGEYAQDAYAGLAEAGFLPGIPAVPSSLASVFNNNWKKNKLRTKYDEAPALSRTGDVTKFTSSAYDNVLVKGDKLRSKVITAAVIDVIGWIKEGLESNPPVISEEGALLEWPGFAKLNSDQKAFFIYRAFVSDHLPVVLDIEVEPLPDDYDLQIQALLVKQRLKSPKLKLLELTYSDCHWIDSCPATESSDWIVTARSIVGIRRVTKFDRQTGFTLQDFTDSGQPISRDFSVPIRVIGSPAVTQLAAGIEMKATPLSLKYVEALVDCANRAEYFVAIDPDRHSALLIGRVTKVSRDGLRFRIEVGSHRCVLTRPDRWPNPPEVGSYILAVLEGLVQKEVWVVPK